MVTLVGFIKPIDGEDYQITEFGRMECESDAEALTKGRQKCLSKQWCNFQIKY
jgi:hypothetical protein